MDRSPRLRSDLAGLYNGTRQPRSDGDWEWVRQNCPDLLETYERQVVLDIEAAVPPWRNKLTAGQFEALRSLQAKHELSAGQRRERKNLIRMRNIRVGQLNSTYSRPERAQMSGALVVAARRPNPPPDFNAPRDRSSAAAMAGNNARPARSGMTTTTTTHMSPCGRFKITVITTVIATALDLPDATAEASPA